MNLAEYQQIINELTIKIKDATDVAEKIEIMNLSQGGLLKEIIMANCLGHFVYPHKKQHDAFTIPSLSHIFTLSDIISDVSCHKKYEYLTSLCSKSSRDRAKFQFHDMKISSINERVGKYHATYFGYFNVNNPMVVFDIKEAETSFMIDIVIDKITNSIHKANNTLQRNNIKFELENYINNNTVPTLSAITNALKSNKKFHISIYGHEINNLASVFP